jgi:hypothetical protein
MLIALAALMLTAPAPAAARSDAAPICFHSSTIWFGRGKAALTEQATHFLDMFLEAAQRAGVPPTYDVEGGGDAVPGHPFDRRLALRRARVMRRFFLRRGIRGDRVKIVIGDRLRFAELDAYAIELSDAGHARAFAPLDAARKVYMPGSIIECF